MKKTILTLITLAFISTGFISCAKKTDAPAAGGSEAGKVDSAAQKHKDGYKAVSDMFTSGNFADIGKYIDSNFVEHTPDPGQKPGLAGLVESFSHFRMGFPDLKYEIVDLVNEGDLLVAHIRMSGTNTGEMMGMKPSGKKFDVTGVDIIKFKGDKAVEHWGYWQEKKMMQQLGMLPSDEEMMKMHQPAKK